MINQMKTAQEEWSRANEMFKAYGYVDITFFERMQSEVLARLQNAANESRHTMKRTATQNLGRRTRSNFTECSTNSAGIHAGTQGLTTVGIQ